MEYWQGPARWVNTALLAVLAVLRSREERRSGRTERQAPRHSGSSARRPGDGGPASAGSRPTEPSGRLAEAPVRASVDRGQHEFGLHQPQEQRRTGT